MVFSFCVLLTAVCMPSIDIRKGIFPISLFILFTFSSNIFYGSGQVLFSISSLHVTDGGLSVAVVRSLRVLELIYAARILGALVPISEMTTAMSIIFQPLGKTGLPVNEFFNILRLTLHCLPKIKSRVQQECDRYIDYAYNGTRITGVAKAASLSRVFIPEILVPFFIDSIMHPEQYFENKDENDIHVSFE